MDIEDFPTVDGLFKPFKINNTYETLKDCMEKMLIEDFNSREEVTKFIREYQKIHSVSMGNYELLYAYRIMCSKDCLEYDEKYETLLQKKTHRSQSGVMIITLVFSYKPNGQDFTCEFDCKYCPSQPGQPRSYLKEEPGVARANRLDFDPVLQFRDRGISYIVNGHMVDKIEVIVLGGTLSSFPEEYVYDFINKMYYAANTFFDNTDQTNLRQMKTLEEELKINESTKCRVIGLTLETRPDCINKKELIKFRKLGVTRVQIGVQHIDDRILQRIDRRCNTNHTIKAIKMLKDNCFKVDIHLMPDLPKPLKLGVDPHKKELEQDDIDLDFDMYEADIKMFNTIYTDQRFQVDQQKLYPVEVTPHTKLKDEYERGLHKPYGEIFVPHPRIKKYTKLHELLIYAKTIVPKYIRLNRIIRDIPSQYILGGLTDVSMRQVLQLEMKRLGRTCKCIRCKEVKKQKINTIDAKLICLEFDSSDEKEYFLSFETPDEKTLFGFLRLRLIKKEKNSIIFDELKGCAMIRELHVYGQTTIVGDNSRKKEHYQHVGFGSRLVREAFRIAKENGFSKIAVISGNGVKDYYRKFGFEDKEFFMIKDSIEDSDFVTPVAVTVQIIQRYQWAWVKGFLIWLFELACVFALAQVVSLAIRFVRDNY